MGFSYKPELVVTSWCISNARALAACHRAGGVWLPQVTRDGAQRQALPGQSLGQGPWQDFVCDPHISTAHQQP